HVEDVYAVGAVRQVFREQHVEQILLFVCRQHVDLRQRTAARGPQVERVPRRIRERLAVLPDLLHEQDAQHRDDEGGGDVRDARIAPRLLRRNGIVEQRGELRV